MKKIIILLICSSFLFSCSNEEQDIESQIKGTAKTFELIYKQKQGNALRKAIKWNIYSEKANSFNDRAKTVVKALKLCIKQENVDTCYVNLEPSQDLIMINKGFQYASGYYAPDGKGNGSGNDQYWEIMSSNKIYTAQELSIISLWEENRSKFIENNVVNEDLLKNHISKILNIPVDEIHLPFVFWKDAINNKN